METITSKDFKYVNGPGHNNRINYPYDITARQNVILSSSSSDSSSSSSGDSEGRAWSINTDDALDMVQKGIKLDYTDTFAPFPSPASSIITVAPKETFENLNSFDKKLINHEDIPEDYEVANTKFFRNNTMKRPTPKDFLVPIAIPDDDHTVDFKIMREKSIIRHLKIKSHSDLLALGNNSMTNTDINHHDAEHAKNKTGAQSATDLTRLNKQQQLNLLEKNSIQKNKKDVSFVNARKNKSTTSFLLLFSKSRSKMSVETDDIINADRKAEFNSKTLNSIRRKDKTIEDIKAYKKEGFLQRRREKKEKKKELKRKKEILIRTYQENNEFPDIPPAFLLNPDARLLHVPDKVLENAEKSFPHTIKKGTGDTEDFLEFTYVPFSKSNLNLQGVTKRYSAPVMPLSRVSQVHSNKNNLSGVNQSQTEAKRKTLPERSVDYQSINSVMGNKENVTPKAFENSKSHNDLNSYGKETSSPANFGKKYLNDTSNYYTKVKIISNESVNSKAKLYHNEEKPQLRHTGLLKNRRNPENSASSKPKKKFPGSSSTSSLSKKYQFRSDGKINNAIMDYYSSGEEDEEDVGKMIHQRNLALKKDIFSNEDTDEEEGFLMNNHNSTLQDSRIFVAKTLNPHTSLPYPASLSRVPIPSYLPPPVPSKQDLPYPKNILDNQQRNTLSVQNNISNQNLHVYDSTVRQNPRKTKFTLGSLYDDDDDDEDEESFYDAASIQFNGSSIDEFKNPAALTTGMLANTNLLANEKSSKAKQNNNPKGLNRLDTFNSTAVRINFK